MNNDVPLIINALKVALIGLYETVGYVKENNITESFEHIYIYTPNGDYVHLDVIKNKTRYSVHVINFPIDIGSFRKQIVKLENYINKVLLKPEI